MYCIEIRMFQFPKSFCSAAKLQSVKHTKHTPNSIFCAVNMDRKRFPNNLWPRPVITPQRCIYVLVKCERIVLVQYSALNCTYTDTRRGGVKKKKHARRVYFHPLLQIPTQALYSQIVASQLQNIHEIFLQPIMMLTCTELTAVSTGTSKLIVLHFCQVEHKETMTTSLDNQLIIWCIIITNVIFSSG